MEAEYSSEDHPPDQSPDISNILGNDNPQEHNKAARVTNKCFFGLTVEPVLFFTVFGSSVPTLLLTNLLLIRFCEHMNLPNCSTIDTPGGPLENIVQPYVSDLNLYRSLFESFIPAITSFFIGSWSDTYGRRPLMIFPLLGHCLNYILLIGFAHFDVPPMFVILTSAPLVFLGGSMTLFTGTFCYINDICPKKNLAFRMAIAEGALYSGILCSNIAAPYIFDMFPSHGFEGVFSIGFVFCLIALLYAIFLLPESIIIHEHSTWERLKALADYRQAVDLFRVCFGHHEGHSRSVRLLLVGTSLLSLIALEGPLAVNILYCRSKFSWDIKDYSLYSDASLLMGIFGTVLGTFLFSKWLKLPEAKLSCFAFLLRAVGYVIAGLGNCGWFMYVSSAVGSLGGMTGPLTRTIISDTAPKNDIGKLFSIISAFSSTVPIVAGLSYTMLYNGTINTFLGAIYLFSAALSLTCCILFGVVTILYHNQHPYMLTSDEQDQNHQLPSS